MVKENEDVKINVLDELFECREEDICVITKEDRKKISELTKNNSKYEKVLDYLDEITNDDKQKEKIKDSLESYIDGINIVSAYENQKFYEIRFYGWCKTNNRMYWKLMLIPK